MFAIPLPNFLFALIFSLRLAHGVVYDLVALIFFSKSVLWWDSWYRALLRVGSAKEIGAPSNALACLNRWINQTGLNMRDLDRTPRARCATLWPWEVFFLVTHLRYTWYLVYLAVMKATAARCFP